MNYYTRRTCLGLALATAFAAQAQSYPSKATTIVAPFAPGASADGIARIVARGLATALGQPVVVENKPGAGGATGLLTVAHAAPDGYTLGIGATGAIAVNPHLPDAAPLKPQKDLMPLAKLADIPLVLVAGAKSGFESLPILLEKARNTPDGINFGTSGQYTSQHLSGELLASMARIKLLAVPYRGSGPAITDLLGGQLPIAVVDLTSAYPHIKSGALKALGVTSATRSKVAPEIPTIAEGGVPGYSAPAWMGLFGPAKIPDAVAQRVLQAVESLMSKTDVQQQILSLAAEPNFQDGPTFTKFIRSESDKWGEVIKKMPKPAQ